jgi:hypothetical protein
VILTYPKHKGNTGEFLYSFKEFSSFLKISKEKANIDRPFISPYSYNVTSKGVGGNLLLIFQFTSSFPFLLIYIFLIFLWPYILPHLPLK